jgi:hypothetical protein
MKILLQYITSAFVNKEIELAEAGSMVRSLLNFAGNKQIEVYHAGKNIEFWDNIDDVDFDNLTVNWGGYGSRISVDKLYDYFKFVYPGDEIVDGRIKTKVKIKSKPFTLVKAFFEEDVPNEIMYPECGCGGYEPSVEDFCMNPLDKEYSLPGYLQNQVLALTSQKLLSTYFRINDDKTSDNKDDQVSPK